jgi:hypothetical protein
MPDALSIKDLPDTSKILDSEGYVVSGKWLRVQFAILKQLWNGENITAGPGVRVRQYGSGGVSISSTAQAGGSSSVPPLPYQGSDASSGSTPAVKITPGTHAGFPATIGGTALGAVPAPVLTLSTGTGVVYVQVDFTYDAFNNLTIVDNEINYSISSTAPTSVVTPSGTGGGTGTLYQSLFMFTATVAGSKASVQIHPYVSGSQNFNVCTATIIGPWGV